MNEGLRRNLELNGGCPKGYALTPAFTLTGAILENLEKKKENIKLYATISTWMDSDIIEATIKNCFSLGCERVYIIDNMSSDDTLNIAMDNGAILAESYTTQYYDDDYRMTLMNNFCKKITEQEKHKELWWLNLDSDEFPVSKSGKSLLEILGFLPDPIRTLGFNFIDLYPTSPFDYESGKHPAECMGWGSKRFGGSYRYGNLCNHWKHPILRYDNGIYDVYQSRGCHAPSLPYNKGIPPINELDETFWCFHAPFRRRDTTSNRLRMLCSTGRNKLDDGVTGNQGAIKRWESLEAVYSGRWDQVEIPHTQMYGRNVKGISLYEWRKIIPELSHLFLKEDNEKREASKQIELPRVNL